MHQASTNPTVDTLIARGVSILDPPSTHIDPAITPDRIAPGVQIYPGCRILGTETSIGPGCVLGREGPLTLENCQLQRNNTLGGGFCAESTFLAGAALGADAHVRPGTLMEEESGGGHAVGLKQTILMPFVTTGSLINFCDCLMAGGTSRRHHSEIGSSFIHFNFTPNQDKATASLIGDVPRGVMLDQSPIFLGGQGGLVGPARIAYGSVIAAGSVWRGDIDDPGRLHYAPRREGSRTIIPGTYLNARRLLRNNILYIANLHALSNWYEHVRARCMQADAFDAAAARGAHTCINRILSERLKRLDELVDKLAISATRLPPSHATEAQFQAALAEKWPALQRRLATASDQAAPRARFLAQLPSNSSNDYVQTIRALNPEARRLGTAWLQAVVDGVASAIPE